MSIIKKFFAVAILGFGLLSFSTLSHASESTHSHAEEAVTHSHAAEAVHSNGVEEIQTSDIGARYVPCPETGGPHSMQYMSTKTSNGGNTGTSHYHENRYCQPYIKITKKLYTCSNCGYDEWRETSATVHPGL